MCRIDERVVRKLEQLVEYRVVLRTRITILEIGAASATNEQRVASEHPVVHEKTIGVVCVARCVEDIKRDALDRELVPFVDAHGDDINVALLAHYRDAMGTIPQRAKPSDMIGMKMAVDGLHEF